MRNKILFDALVLYGARTGYSRVFTEMLKEFSARRDRDFHLIVLIQRSGLKSIEYSPSAYPGIEFVVCPDIRSKLIRGCFEQIVVPMVALLRWCDVIHCPATFGLVLPLRPTLVTFHTGTSFSVPGHLKGRSRFQATLHNILIKVTMRTASRLAITTATTAQELFDYLGFRKPFFIIGNGLSKTLVEPDINVIPEGFRALLSRRYILSVSQFYRLKNQNHAITAFIKAKSDGTISSDFQLILVGAIQEQDYFEECCALCRGRDDVVFLEGLSDGELALLYKHTALYLFLSLFEGFGLTPLEALARNIPVVLSSIPVLQEVYGPGFVYVNPLDDVSIVDGIRFALAPKYACFCTQNPICSRYSWTTICDMYQSTYADMAK